MTATPPLPPGIRLGHATDDEAGSGVTTLLFDRAVRCAVAVHGGAPGTRETDALAPGNLNPPVDAIVLSGGSAFGLAAADGVQAALAARGQGFTLGPHTIPIVPAAILFDLSEAPRADHRALGEHSVATATATAAEGSVGAGRGATAGLFKGGLGIASEPAGDYTVTAFIACNAVGSAVTANGPWFRAHMFERERECGGLTPPPHADFATAITKLDTNPAANTVIGALVTDAPLSHSDLLRLARTAHDGLAVAIFPSHTVADGDTLFATSIEPTPTPLDMTTQIGLGAAAVRAVARATMRGIFQATAAPTDTRPTWRHTYGTYLTGTV
ncbi:MAG: P1 family peptidase [Pseudomonadota bacterium]